MNNNIITLIGQKDQHRSFWCFWMLAAFARMSREERQKKILSYDNMCHLDNLKVAKRPLPLPGNLTHLWLDITKIIDTLHIANHKDSRCRETYSPQQLKKEHPHINTMCCEHGYRDISGSWVHCQKHIIISIYIVWWSGEMRTLRDATCKDDGQWYRMWRPHMPIDCLSPVTETLSMLFY